MGRRYTARALAEGDTVHQRFVGHFKLSSGLQVGLRIVCESEVSPFPRRGVTTGKVRVLPLSTGSFGGMSGVVQCCSQK